MYYGYKIEITEDGKKKYNICKTPNETLQQLEYYLKFPPYVKNRTIRILDITKKEVKDGIFDKLPWYSRGSYSLLNNLYKKIKNQGENKNDCIKSESK